MSHTQYSFTLITDNIADPIKDNYSMNKWAWLISNYKIVIFNGVM